MAWFRKEKKPMAVRRGRSASPIPEGLWTKCDGCKEAIFGRELEKNLQVCPKCGYHFRIDSQARIRLLLDEEQPRELLASLRPADPLGFVDSKRYRDRLKVYQQEVGTRDAVVVVEGRVEGQEVVLAAMEYRFMGGSMGSVVGEKIARAAEIAADRRLPLIVVSASAARACRKGSCR